MPATATMTRRSKTSAATRPIEPVREAPRPMSTSRQWEAYRFNGDPEIREQLLARYLPLVRNVAGRMALGTGLSVGMVQLRKSSARQHPLKSALSQAG